MCLIEINNSSITTSTFSSPRQDNEEMITSKPAVLNPSQNPNPNPSNHVDDSEELLRKKKDEELTCLKETYAFLKELAEKLKRSQATINTAMVYVLKYTRIYSFEYINKYLVAASSFLLAAKYQDEPVPIEYLVEWYIYFETKRSKVSACLDISSNKKDEYKARIQDQEFDLLTEFGFDCEVDLPNKYIHQFAATPLGKVFAKSAASKLAYMFLNDSFLTPAVLYYPPQYIAAACIMMALVYIKKLNKPSRVDLSVFDETEWYKTIDDTLDQGTVIEVKDEIKKCYAQKASSS